MRMYEDSFLRVLIDELYSRTKKQTGVVAGLPQSRYVVDTAGTSLPTADGPSAVVLDFGATTLPGNTNFMITGWISLTNTQNAVRTVKINLENSPGGGPALLQSISVDLPANGGTNKTTTVPISWSIQPAAANSHLVVTAVVTTGGAAPGDVVVASQSAAATISLLAPSGF